MGVKYPSINTCQVRKASELEHKKSQVQSLTLFPKFILLFPVEPLIVNIRQ